MDGAAAVVLMMPARPGKQRDCMAKERFVKKYHAVAVVVLDPLSRQALWALFLAPVQENSVTRIADHSTAGASTVWPCGFLQLFPETRNTEPSASSEVSRESLQRRQMRGSGKKMCG